MNDLPNALVTSDKKITKLQVGDKYYVHWDGRMGTGVITVMRGDECLKFNYPAHASTRFTDLISAVCFGNMIAALYAILVRVDEKFECVEFTVMEHLPTL